MVEAVFIGTFVPLVLMMGLLRHSRPVFGCFCWGMLSFLLVYLVSPPLNRLFGIEGNLPLAATTVGPVLEEVIKAVPLYGLAFFAARSFTPFLYILGLSCGIGFAIEENLIYLIRFHESDGESRLLMVMRSFSTCLMHGVATGFTGYSATVARRARGWVSIFPLPLGLLFASIYHAVFNTVMLEGHHYAGMIGAILLFILFLVAMKELESRAPETKGTMWE